MDLNQVRRVCRRFSSKNTLIRCLHINDLDSVRIDNVKPNNLMGIIVLTNGDAGRFGHFLLIVRNDKELLFFDSFGLPVEMYDNRIGGFIKKHVGYKRIRWRRRVQDMSSITCGAHVCVMMSLISRSKNLRSGCRDYDCMMTSNYISNDRKVVQYIFKKFRLKGSCKEIFCDSENSTTENCKQVCSL